MERVGLCFYTHHGASLRGLRARFWHRLQAELLGPAAFPRRFSLADAVAATTLGEWDEAYTAPLYGFRSKDEYYRTQVRRARTYAPMLKGVGWLIFYYKEPNLYYVSACKLRRGARSGKCLCRPPFKNYGRCWLCQGCASGGFLRKVRVPSLAINALDDPFMDPTSLPTVAGAPCDVGPLAPVRLVCHAYGGHCGFVSATPPSSPSGAPSLQRKDWLPEELGRFVEHCERSYLRSQAAPLT